MPVVLDTKIYKCNYCETVRKTLDGIYKHENECPKNSKKKATFLARKAELEEIRTTSKTPHEIISRLQAFWLSCGVKVTFTEYPATWNDMVQNSHNAPKGYPTNWGRGQPELPRGYPGWQGNWRGVVEVIDKNAVGKNYMSFSDLCDRWERSDIIPTVSFIHIGSGVGAEKFQYSGMMFLYDFPTMHEEWKANGGEFDQMSLEYADLLKNYNEMYEKESKKFIDSQNEVTEIRALLRELSITREEVQQAVYKTEAHFKNEFNKKHNVPLKSPDTILVEHKDVMKAKCNTDFVDQTVHPDLKKVAREVKRLQGLITAYMMKNPEIFI